MAARIFGQKGLKVSDFEDQGDANGIFHSLSMGLTIFVLSYFNFVSFAESFVF